MRHSGERRNEGLRWFAVVVGVGQTTAFAGEGAFVVCACVFVRIPFRTSFVALVSSLGFGQRSRVEPSHLERKKMMMTKALSLWGTCGALWYVGTRIRMN